MTELADLLHRPSAPVDARVASAIAAGPMDRGDALRFAELASLLDPGYQRVETGYCTHPDGRGYVAVLTKMPGVTSEMLDWWFDWHPRDSLRYRVWFPQEHFDIRFEPPVEPGSKPFYNAVHHPVEDIGLGRDKIRIEFLDPVEFGFPAGWASDGRCATIICGNAGSDRRRARHTKMCHFARATDDGVELRSRFWIGEEIDLYWPTWRLIKPILSTPFVREIAVPKEAPKVLARHCAQEYANLAELLPELWDRYGR